MIRPLLARRRGFTLIEVVVCMGILSMLSLLAWDLWRDGTLIHRSCMHYRLGMREVQSAFEQLRRDVRLARGTASEAGGRTAGDDVLILDQGETRVVYRRQDDRLVREAFRGAEPVDGGILVRGVEALSFASPAAPGRPDLVGFSIRLRRWSDSGRIDPVFDGVAAFRGISR